MAQKEIKDTGKTMPEKKFRAGGVVATVWNNKVDSDGKEIEYKTISIDRSYKNNKDEWQKTNSYRINDLPKVELVAKKAYDYIIGKDE